MFGWWRNWGRKRSQDSDVSASRDSEKIYSREEILKRRNKIRIIGEDDPYTEKILNEIMEIDRPVRGTVDEMGNLHISVLDEEREHE